MTKRAACFAAAALALLLVALSTGARVYYLLFFAMLLMLALGLVSVTLALITVKVKIKCPKRSVERGQSLPVSVYVSHLSVVPVKSIVLKLAVPEDAGMLDEVEIDAMPFKPQVYNFKIVCPHRGVYRVGVDRIAVTDVFGLIEMNRRSESCSFTVEALPKVADLDSVTLTSTDVSENRIVHMTDDYASPSDTRSWRSGDALKKVHWKLSMRKRELMVRTYEESARPDTLVLLDLYPASTFKSHALSIEDAVIETAAGIIKAQLGAGYPVKMPLMGAKPTEIRGDSQANFPAFLRELAVVKFDSPYQFEKVLMLETRRMQRTGGAVLITPKLDSRIVDQAARLKMANMSVCVCWITDSARAEGDMAISKLKMTGVMAFKIDPWGEGLSKKRMIEEEYGSAR